jgi:ubiquinone/menaquinone biosynthesis C-methylase UbiE
MAPAFINPENPKTYNKFRQPDSSFHRTKYEKIMHSIPKDKKQKILEIGCGTGIYTRFLVKDFNYVTATDLDKEMCRQTHAKYPSAKVEVADATLLPFKNGSFDGVFGVSILHHISDCNKAFEEISRVLKKGGWIVFCEPNQYNPLTAAVQEYYGEKALTRKKFKRYANHANLKIIEIGEILMRSPRTSNFLDNVPGYNVLERAAEKCRLGFSIYMVARK